LRVVDQLKHAWNVFTNRPDNRYASTFAESYSSGSISSARPDRVRRSYSNERSIISAILTRLSIDVSTVDMKHVRTDEQRRYLEDIDSGLNNCLTLEANIDQAARQFRIDMMMTLCDRGVVALVPVDTSINPNVSGGYDILTLRVGDIVAWYPYHVRVSVFNEARGIREEVTLEKKFVAIIENPLYSVMNEPNSTLQRLIRKLNLLDGADEQIASGKLDLIIQLPYVIKSEARRQQAEQRRKDIEFQLKGSQYGIAYTDGTEKITQLNRPAENNLLVQIEYLTKLLYSQLGLTEEVMLGTADEKAMINYFNRTVEPFLTAIVEAMRRSFLTKTARSQRQTVMYFRDPFRLAPLEQIAEIADKFTRNEIVTSNEMRQAIGMAPHKDPKADQLINANMPVGDTGVQTKNPSTDPVVEKVLAKVATNGNGDGSNN
jgi:Phage portal protein